MKASQTQHAAKAASRIRLAHGSCWEPAQSPPLSLDDDEADAARLTWSRVELEDEIIAAFDVRPEPGEQTELAFRRKEQLLAAAFVKLVPAESLALQRRLSMALPGDPIAERFARLVVSRRTRLLAVLADSRCRHPLQMARAGGCRG